MIIIIIKKYLKKQTRKEMKNMPRGDGTGPWGLGPMTGRAAGYCAGYPVPGFMNPYIGRLGLGFGWGRGRGRGFRRTFWPAYSYSMIPPLPYGIGLYQPTVEPKQEIGILNEEAKALKEQLEVINKRISELEEAEKK